MFSVDTTNITNITDVFDFIGVPFSVQIFLYIYNTVLPIVALLGNGIVIYSSIKYNLLNMESTLMALLTNVAIADFYIVFTTFIPKATTIYAKKWVLGKAICFINADIPSVGGLCEMSTLAFLSSYKLYRLTFPFHGTLSLRQAVGLICVFWVWSSIPAVQSILTNSFAYFDPNAFDCFISTYSVSC